MDTARNALQRLKDGNARFVEDAADLAAQPTSIIRGTLVGGQAPFAAILSCSDARVPAELVFDQGLGDLFVVRVAGNVAAASQIGSLEFATEQLGSRLIVVMGHTNCGAVDATVQQVTQGATELSPGLGDIVDRIRPAVEDITARCPNATNEEIIVQATREHVHRTIATLEQDSAILRSMIENNGLRIVGAVYAIDTGEVTFFDEPDDVV